MAASLGIVGCGGASASRAVQSATGQVNPSALGTQASASSPVGRRVSPPRSLSNRPGVVSQAEIKAYPYTLIRALSTERYAVTPELSGSLGKATVA